ncbi:hypothetical protein KSP40_PGU013392 [Platanthera guangdongensis]|uniref:Subtilisin inhibitor n=1 Tax=Platanthera guangdongensis TaxID=2320717 RepID=A0ABR2LYA6_9ASPA
MDDETNLSASKKHDDSRASKKRYDGERQARNNWPEVVGLTGEDAKKRIKEEDPGFQLQIVGPDRMVTMDFRTDRVRIYVDSEGKVIDTPMVG